MELHAALVAGLEDELQRVPGLLGSLPLASRQVLAPGLEGTGVPGIPLGAHLEEDGVAAELVQGLDAAQQEVGRVVGTELGVFAPVDRGEPGRA